MSLILEALRKSEAQRRLGQAPDLLSPMPGAERTAARWRRRGAYAAALVVVAAAAWWSGQQHATAPEIARVDDDAPVPQAAVVPVPTAAPAAAPTTSPAAEPAQPTQPAPSTATAAPPRVHPVERPATQTPPRTAPSTPARDRSVAPAPASAATRANVPPPAPLPLPVPLPPPDFAAPPPTAPSAPALPSLAELPATERGALPPLRITMHVYAEVAAQRFAIIDGHRVSEGALLADGVMVAEIVRDGVVLDLRGRRFWLPRP